MFILNTTYITTKNNEQAWKNWLKEDAFSQSIAFQAPDFRVYRIDHVDAEDQVSFAVQFPFDNMAMLDLFQEELEKIHQNSLAKRFGAQCVFFMTVLSHEKI